MKTTEDLAFEATTVCGAVYDRLPAGSEEKSMALQAMAIMSDLAYRIKAGKV